MKYLTERAVRAGDSQLIKQKSKFLKAHTSSGHKQAIDELLGEYLIVMFVMFVMFVIFVMFVMFS